ncbi:hypothetical protein Syun_000570 [Stephania yunnanensis]|uniref:Uncharacterized protein n=1 Tax=Stephania yunnanensis TaxID=152371 RepID=A0AAP0Q5P3_9MAGN
MQEQTCQTPGREAIHESSTGVKLGRRPCRYESREVVAEETRDSVKEELGASSGGGGPDPSSGDGRGSRASNATEELGASSSGGTGGRRLVVVASDGGNVEAVAESNGTRDVGKGG